MAQPAPDNATTCQPSAAQVQARLQSLSAETTEERQNEIRRQIRSNGVVHSATVTGKFENRPWQLELAPFVIEASDWLTLCTGLSQRARLRSLLFTDLYTNRELIRQAVVPARGIFAHGGYMRAAHDLPCIDTLPLYSTEIARSASGEWLVLGDSPESLAGCGYALENRHVLSRVLATLFKTSSVERLGQFLSHMRQSLMISTDPDQQTVMLGYGSTDPSILEISYLSKHLGCTLVSLDDLVVRQRRVWLKTVEGLQRVDTIIRFVDDKHLDPLASATATKGIPGILSVVRAGNVRLLNPPGVHALANPVFDAFEDALFQFYLNEEPLLRSVKTFWLGVKNHYDLVLQGLDELTIRNINTPLEAQVPASMSNAARRALIAKIDNAPYAYVAQEKVTQEKIGLTAESLTTPSHEPHTKPRLEQPRLPAIQTFMLRNDTGYTVMPGGLGTLAEKNCSDVWIIGQTDAYASNAPNPAPTAASPRNNDFSLAQPSAPNRLSTPITLHTRSQNLDAAATPSALPSRFAENLFWFGRYTERSENSLRLLRTILQQFQSDACNPQTGTTCYKNCSPATNALLRALTTTTGTYPGFVGDGAEARLQDPDEELLALIYTSYKPGALLFSLNQLQHSGDEVRERISPDLFRFLNELDDRTQTFAAVRHTGKLANDSDELNRLVLELNNMLTVLAAIAGLTYENFVRGDGWRFIELGRRIERARFSSTLLHSALRSADMYSESQSHDTADIVLLENLLQVFDSLMTYRSRYGGELSTDKVLNLLLFDENNPRSISFQFVAIEREVLQLPGLQRTYSHHPLLRLGSAGLSRVRLANATALLQAGCSERQSFSSIMQQLESIPAELANRLAASYFTHTETRNSLGSQPDESSP